MSKAKPKIPPGWPYQFEFLILTLVRVQVQVLVLVLMMDLKEDNLLLLWLLL